MHAEDLEVLDNLLADLAERPVAEGELLREHLEMARAFLVGAMPDEYQLNLQLAEETLSGLPDPHLRARLQDFIQGQLHPVNAH